MPTPGQVDEIDPAAAYRVLAEMPGAALVDVRTLAEWTFVGLPDLSALGTPVHTVEWVSFPGGAPNPQFLPQLSAALDGAAPERLFFLCRSGQRSLYAAEAAAAAGLAPHCTNIGEGFEGALDAQGHRGAAAGWKARGLPWRQS